MSNILIRGCPGTGKTFFARAVAYYMCKKNMTEKDAFAQNPMDDAGEIEKFVNGTAQCEFIQIHPSMEFDDIVYGLEVKASGGISLSYTEKRVMKLCNLARGKSDKYCVIFDDINRANASSLLGNLLYAMEYRNQDVELSNGSKMNIPENVIFIFTENTLDARNELDLAVRRRMSYLKELKADKEVIRSYYRPYISSSALNLVIDIYDRVEDYILSYFQAEPGIDPTQYIKSKKILKEKFSSEASVNGKINFCLNSLRHVKVTNISNTDINSSNVGGLYSYYKPAIQQARAILSLNFQSHNEKNGENEKGFVYTIPYTINMETLFEYYARTELKKALKGSEYRVEQYSKKLYLQKDIDNVDDAEKGIHLMSFCIPDIIIYKEDKPVVVIDAKYKLSGRPDRSDSHQLLSYVLLTGADRCGFVLPGEKTEVKEMVSTGDNYLPLAPRILRYYELLLGSKSDSSELQKVLQ